MPAADAVPVPRKNVAYRLIFWLLDKDGKIISTPAGLATAVSKDGGGFAATSNAAVEIGTSGVFFLDLTAAEMNADSVIMLPSSTDIRARPFPWVLYPEEAGDIRVQVTDIVTAMLNAISDDVLRRPLSAVETTAAFRSLSGAIAKMVNKVDIADSSLRIRKTDDVTIFGTQTVTTNADAAPITAVDTD